ncbi:hypothetical protein BJX64DRAFT_145243 [Aspergillus heterothallicus]
MDSVFIISDTLFDSSSLLILSLASVDWAVLLIIISKLQSFQLSFSFILLLLPSNSHQPLFHRVFVFWKSMHRHFLCSLNTCY